MNLLKKYMNGVDIQIMNLEYYIEELETVQPVKLFMNNVITKVLLFVYIKMIKEIFLGDIPLFLGKKMTELSLQKIVLYLL